MATMEQSQGAVGREMPRYQSHKQVWALMILAITIGEGVEYLEDFSNAEKSAGDEITVAAYLTPAEDGYAPIPVSRAYMLKHNPKVGGYYVVYPDGYKSFSPADAFESGYTRI